MDIGSSYLPSGILAAFLFAQLESREHIQKKRRALWGRYAQALSSWAQASGVRLPIVPEDREQAYHMFCLLMPSLQLRQDLIQHLKERGIAAVFHYLPLHLSEMGSKFGGRPGDCPVTEFVSDRLVRLPFFNELTIEVQDRVINAVMDFKVAHCMASASSP